jgi:quercetin dioxygenase-like cupin family protein
VPSQPRIVWMPGGVRTEIHLTGAETGGAFCLLVDHPPAGWSLPAHIHKDAAETIHVIEGEFEMTVAGTTARLGPGETLHVPAGVVHAGGNVGDGPGRRLLTFTPAGMEEFFREAGAPSPEAESDRAATLAAALRHGWRFVD